MKRRGGYAFLTFFVLAVIVGAAAIFAPQAQSSGAIDPASLDPTVLVENSGGLGSGVYIGDNTIITAAHMMGEGDRKADPKSWSVTVNSDGIPTETVGASVLWVAADQDIMALHLDVVPPDLGTATLDDADAAINTPIEVIGNPLRQRFIHTHGHVAGAIRDESKLLNIPWHYAIPIDVAFTNGNSGGPAYKEGTHEVVGIIVGFALNIHRGAFGEPTVLPGTVNFMISSKEVVRLINLHRAALDAGELQVLAPFPEDSTAYPKG